MTLVEFLEKHNDLAESFVQLLANMPQEPLIYDVLEKVLADKPDDTTKACIHALVSIGYKHDNQGREIMDPVKPTMPKGCKIPDSLPTLLERIRRNPYLAFKERENMVFDGVDEDLEQDDEYFDEPETPWEQAGREVKDGQVKGSDSEPESAPKDSDTGVDDAATAAASQQPDSNPQQTVSMESLQAILAKNGIKIG